jgi:pilus assembly protein Flp/PilA
LKLNIYLTISLLEGGTEMLYLPREEGQGLVEYALILVLIAVVVIAVLTLLGGQVQGVFQSIADQLNP